MCGCKLIGLLLSHSRGAGTCRWTLQTTHINEL